MSKKVEEELVEPSYSPVEKLYQSTKLSIETLIEQAIDLNLPVESLQRLLDMAERIEARRAKEAFDRALVEFQSRVPIIQNTKEVRNKQGMLRYKFSPIDSIIVQVRPLLKECGLNYSVDSHINMEAGTATSVCIITHIGGHAERNSYTLPFNESARSGTGERIMSKTQEVEGTLTTTERKAFCKILGIVTSDEDYNGEIVEEEKITEASLNRIRELLVKVERRADELTERYHVGRLEDLTETQAQSIITLMEIYAKRREQDAS